MCPTEHLWLWDLSIGLQEDQWCNWMTTKAQLYPPLLLWNNVPTIINCGISDGVQTVSKLISSRNNCTSTNHTGSLMSTAELPPVSCGSTREVISLCPASLGTGGSWWYGVRFHSLWPSIHLPTCLSICHFSALGKQQRLFSFWLFCLALQIGDLQGFVMNFPKTDTTRLGLVLVVLAFTWSLKSVAPSSCHDFTHLLLVLVDPACLLWVSPYSSLGFLLCYTPHLKATFYTFVTGRFHVDISTASPCICVYRNWRSPNRSLFLCCTGTAALGRERNVFPLCS